MLAGSFTVEVTEEEKVAPALLDRIAAYTLSSR
jgi:hypothetical protein